MDLSVTGDGLPVRVVGKRMQRWHQLVLGLCGCFGVACSDTSLTPLADAGLTQEPDVDDPPVDAGHDTDGGIPLELDAGIVDAGVPGPESDAGTPCIFPGNVAVPFECEGDEDVCDSPDDVDPSEALPNVAFANILATWSHVSADTDEWVLQVRFAGFPLRLPEDFASMSLVLELLASMASTERCDPCVWPDSWAWIISENAFPARFPPEINALFPYDIYDIVDPCSVYFSENSPLIEYRIPLQAAASADGTVSYALSSHGGSVFRADHATETSESGPASNIIRSEGGSAAVDPSMVSICELQCLEEQSEGQ
jgi:hypothetical protein